MFSKTILLIISFCLIIIASISAATYNCGFVCGDANGDGTVNILDITFLIAYLYQSGDAPDSDYCADVDGSGSINILDITTLIAYLYQGGAPLDKCPYMINIVNLNPGDNTVHGTANVFDNSQFKVVLWAKTNIWYVQPSISNPYTNIQSDGTWSNSTYPWDRMVALLVDTSYVPGSTRDYHPSMDPGVVAWDEYPEKSMRYIYWSGYCWRVKTGDLVGPGPNYFSDDASNVWIDQQDRLHLKIDYRDNNWYCAEIVLNDFLGYGKYSFKLDSRVDSLDYNTILGAFIYEMLNQEFDIEFSQRLAEPYNAQYVAQPWYTEGNIERFNMPSFIQTSHYFYWLPDQVICNSWVGHADNPTPETLIHSWIYTGPDNPTPTDERMIFNLYLYGGEAPVEGIGDEVIINSFEYSE